MKDDALLEWMYETFPNYEKVGKFAGDLTLKNTEAFCAYLGNPQKNLTVFHVAGTNGKGSVSHMIASILMEHGYSVGVTASPHLVSLRERIKVDGKMVPPDFVVDFLRRHKGYLLDNDLSFFEAMTGMALEYFAQSQVDYTIIEVGLGGRLDATNIVSPIVSVITNISLDHTRILGNTVQEIAREKSGIIKKDTPVVIGQTEDAVRRIFEDVAVSRNAPIIFAQDIDFDLKSIQGEAHYQKENMQTAYQALVQAPIELKYPKVVQALKKLSENTGLRGRFETVKQSPRVIIDGAHNPAGVRALMRSIQKLHYNNLHIIWGMMKDKQSDEIYAALPRDATYYFTQTKSDRTLVCQALKIEASTFSLQGEAYSTLSQAYSAAITSAQDKDIVLVAGSLYLVGEMLKIVDSE